MTFLIIGECHIPQISNICRHLKELGDHYDLQNNDCDTAENDKKSSCIFHAKYDLACPNIAFFRRETKNIECDKVFVYL